MLNPRTALADSPLLHGAVLSVGAPGPDYQPVRPGAAGTLHVIAGPDAGFGVALRPGRYMIGRAAAADVCLHDPDASRTHAVIEISPDGKAAVWDVGSINGTFVNDEPGTVSVPVDDGSIVRIGSDKLTWESAGSGALQVSRTPAGWLEFDRVFAEEPSISTQDVDLPPHESSRRSFAAMAVSSAVGIASGLALFAYTHNALMLPVSLLGILAPFAIRAAESPRRRQDNRVIGQARDDVRNQINEHVAKEDRDRHLLAPGHPARSSRWQPARGVTCGHETRGHRTAWNCEWG